MAVNVESLTPAEFLMMLNYEGNPPDDPAFDKIRMSPGEWRTMFPAARATQPTEQQKEETDASAEHPAAAKAAH